jgi:hypothetical protein
VPAAEMRYLTDNGKNKDAGRWEILNTEQPSTCNNKVKYLKYSVSMKNNI